MKQTIQRSILKSVLYRIVAALMTLATIFILTKNLSLSIGATLIDNIFKTVAYFAYERVWLKIKWGVKENE